MNLKPLSLAARLILVTLLVAPFPIAAGDVAIEFARFEAQAGNTWSASVTLRHADTGWDHYADAWRIVSADGRDLGTRTLYHPHVDEQPFTRSLGDIRIPDATDRVFVEAHDNIHGWSPQRLEVILKNGRGDRYEVHR